MILDRLEQAEQYFALHPGFPAAFEFLSEADFTKMTSGRHLIDGERLFVIAGIDPGRGHSGARLEAHQKYIDIQLTLAGDEEIGWKPVSGCHPVSAYQPEKDLQLFMDKPETWLAVRPGSFGIFFPQDAHAPLGGEGRLHKGVVKVAVDWVAVDWA